MEKKQIFAIYSRKSKYTGKGESIENQIEICREYIRLHYGEEAALSSVVYEDEGFSGGNLRRPQFQVKMEAAKDGIFRGVVVYRLDRISRNIGDFVNLTKEFNRAGIDFISVKEQFDTGSSIGRAMMYISGRESGIIFTNWRKQDDGWEEQLLLDIVRQMLLQSI